ncbi:MAG: DUF362 domain-containing protein [Thermodesulfobacteriota bacterium]
MIASKVFFSDFRATARENIPAKLSRLLDEAGIDKKIRSRSLVAIKLHFGERGNSGFIRPIFIRRIVERIKESGGFPFLTDTNTLYRGSRSHSVSHIVTAIENGFAYPVVNAPIILADGLRGSSSVQVRIDQEVFKLVDIGKEIAEADVLIGVAHFKGHELTGFGGAIKNIGMGCASRRGKLEQHSDLSPKINRKRCAGCGECIDHCAQEAISIGQEKAFIDPERCIGCGECIIICSNSAIKVQWGRDIPIIQKKMVEYAFGVLKEKGGRALFINFLTQISPLCDCYGYTDASIVPDIGIMASTDSLAIDQASVDMVNQHTVLNGSSLKINTGPGEDKFRGLYPDIDWGFQLDYAQKIGLGTRNYELIKI